MARAKAMGAGAIRPAAEASEMRPPLAPAIRDEAIDRAVHDLRRIVVGGQIEIVIEVGDYIVRNIYGSVEEARSHRPGKAATLDRLARRADEFGMTAASVRRAVPIALQARAMGRELALRLPPTHHRVLLPVARPEEKRLLAEAAVEGRWTVERLQRELRRVQKRHAGGRPPAPFVQRLVERSERLLGDLDGQRLRQGLGAIAPTDARRLLSRVNKLQAQLERVEKVLIGRR